MGMGLRVAMDLARRGARVIIARPYHNEGAAAVQLIKEETNVEVVFKLLDLSSLQSIRTFAAEIIQNEEKLHILVNNAGVGAVKEFITDDGMSFIMQVNYFGHVLLTLLLLPLLEKSGISSEPARIINTSSFLHYFGTVDFEKLNNIKYYNPARLHANSKLCLVLFSHELTKRFKESNVVVNSVDPRFVGTAMAYNRRPMYGPISCFLLCIVCKTPWEGAQTAIYAALEEEAGRVSGQYFKNCQLSRAKQSAYDHRIALQLWKESIRLIKLSSAKLEECFK